MGLCYEPVATDALLARLTSAPAEAGLFLDFDGVLAPIVSRPEDAYPPATTRVELERLVARYALVGIPAAFGAVGGTALQQRLPVRTLSFLFAGLLVVIAVRMLLQ